MDAQASSTGPRKLALPTGDLAVSFLECQLFQFGNIVKTGGELLRIELGLRIIREEVEHLSAKEQ